MRQLDGRVAAHAHTRRNALNDGFFRCADGGNGAGGIVICIQIDHADKARADRAVFQRALDIDERILERFKHARVEIFLHRAVDQRRVRSLLRRAQLGLGQDEVDGRGRALCVLAHTLPICGVGGKLVAGDDRPLFHGIHLREQDVSRQKCVHAKNRLSKSFVIHGKPWMIFIIAQSGGIS